jgi:hypothetical protein
MNRSAVILAVVRIQSLFRGYSLRKLIARAIASYHKIAYESVRLINKHSQTYKIEFFEFHRIIDRVNDDVLFVDDELWLQSRGKEERASMNSDKLKDLLSEAEWLEDAILKRIEVRLSIVRNFFLSFTYCYFFLLVFKKG